MPQNNPAAGGHARIRWYAGGAALAAAAGAGVGHLVAALVSPEASPVLAVGSSVIDATPTPVKEWAVAQFGTADKPILIGSVAVGAVLLAGGIGHLARTRRRLGLTLLGVLALTSALGAAMRPTSTAVDLLPGLVTAVVGVAAARGFFGLLDTWAARDRDPAARADAASTRTSLARSWNCTRWACAAAINRAT